MPDVSKKLSEAIAASIKADPLKPYRKIAKEHRCSVWTVCQVVRIENLPRRPRGGFAQLERKQAGV